MNIFTILLLLIPAFFTAEVTTKLLKPRLHASEILGVDIHKEEEPHLPEMGGLAAIAGFVFALLIAIGLGTFTALLPGLELMPMLAIGFTLLLIALVGIIDDLMGVRQLLKALIPLFAALPLMAVEAGETEMALPLFGKIDFGIFYPLVLVPIGVTGAANAVNMLAGFNGLEVGLGLVMVSALGYIAWLTQSTTALVVLVVAFGSLSAVLLYNWYPAEILIGDVGTLSIGAIIASAVIIGNFEYGGAIVIIPYVFDLVIKAFSGFPKSFGEYRDGKLYCPTRFPVGLAPLIMKISGGIKERNLVLVLIGIESIFGFLAVLYYL